MNDTLKVDRQSSDYDLYAALMLSSLLDNEQDVKEKQEEALKPIVEQPTETTAVEQDEQEPNHDVIWVPADKHPEIAPTEFANFIKTHGANTPTRKCSSLRRRKSILSQSLSVRIPQDEDEESKLNRTLSEKKRLFLKKVMSDSEKLKDIDTHVFDRNSTALDDSRIIAPRSDRSLLRRSAFSARGRSRKSVTSSDDRQHAQQRRSVSQRKPSSSSINSNETAKTAATTTTNKSWDKSEGISLFDQPVNMSEWIDLGSASLESDDSQRGILSRVHDAESQLRSQIIHDDDVVVSNNKEEETIVQPLLPLSPPALTKEEVKLLDEKIANKKNKTGLAVAVEEVKRTTPTLTTTVPILKHDTTTTTNKRPDGPKRPDIIRSATENNKIPTTTTVATVKEKRTSWLGGLFQQDKKNGKNSNKTTAVTTSNTTTALINNNTLSPLSGLATLFSRSLSMKSNNNNNNNISHNNTSTTNNNNAFNTTTNNNNNNILKSTTTTNKKTTTTTPPSSSLPHNSKKKRSSRLEIPPPSERTFFNSNRLPLHVERAIYRLSHMKLADPRRPLRQQVLISNLMFWYLSIQQNDFQTQQQDERVETETPTPDTQQNKKGNKMARLIHSAKKRKSEVAQFVQAYPLSGNHSHYNNNNETAPKKSNVQFSLAPIPSHHHPALSFEQQEEEEEEEDDVPLSHYRS